MWLETTNNQHEVPITLLSIKTALKVDKSSWISLSENYLLTADLIYFCSTLQVHLHGMGLFDSRIYTMAIDVLTQVLEPLITKTLSEVVCGLLERAVNGPASNEVFMM